MTLRRCDSLPAQLRENRDLVAEDKGGDGNPSVKNKIPDSKTDPNFQETREDVIATWKSLQTDVKNIKNGLHPNNTNQIAIKSSLNSNKTFNKNARKKITYANPTVTREADRSCSYPMENNRATPNEVSVARRRTLLQRLLSWRTGECNCREHYRPKPRPEELLCTCGGSKNNWNSQTNNRKFTERGRSKSVGYEAAREVTQFRRFVQFQ